MLSRKISLSGLLIVITLLLAISVLLAFWKAGHREILKLPQFLSIPAGELTLKPTWGGYKHQYTLRNQSDYKIAETLLTFSAYDIYTKFTFKEKVDDKGAGRGDRPVVNVSWDDAVGYIKWLNLITFSNYRLPTESEWEFAARAGSTDEYSWGSVLVKDKANCLDCLTDAKPDKTSTVKAFEPNALGFYDAQGNVWEWMLDCHRGRDSLILQSAALDDCNAHYVKGGSWANDSKFISPTKRPGYASYLKDGVHGFRLAYIEDTGSFWLKAAKLVENYLGPVAKQSRGATENQSERVKEVVVKQIPSPESTIEAVPKTDANMKKLAEIFGYSQQMHPSRFWDNMTEIEQEAKNTNVDIDFHGKVIDQDGQPVEGAKISFSATADNENVISMAFRLGREKTPMSIKEAREVYTDGRGLFRVSDLRGTRAYVNDIEKENYLFQAKQNYTYRKSRPETLEQASAQQPEIFVLWKQGESQALLKTDARLLLKPGEDSKPKTIHLVRLPKNPGYVEQGDFRVTVYNQGQGIDENSQVDRQKYDWWVNIEFVDGGMLFTKDTWLYEAPSDGYQKSLRIDEKSDAPDWQSGLRNKKIYFKSHGNYGSAVIKVITHGNGTVGVYLDEVFINPTGSRNLEYDKYKKIQIRYYEPVKTRHPSIVAKDDCGSPLADDEFTNAIRKFQSNKSGNRLDAYKKILIYAFDCPSGSRTAEFVDHFPVKNDITYKKIITWLGEPNFRFTTDDGAKDWVGEWQEAAYYYLGMSDDGKKFTYASIILKDGEPESAAALTFPDKIEFLIPELLNRDLIITRIDLDSENASAYGVTLGGSLEDLIEDAKSKGIKISKEEKIDFADGIVRYYFYAAFDNSDGARSVSVSALDGVIYAIAGRMRDMTFYNQLKDKLEKEMHLMPDKNSRWSAYDIKAENGAITVKLFNKSSRPNLHKKPISIVLSDVKLQAMASDRNIKYLLEKARAKEKVR